MAKLSWVREILFKRKDGHKKLLVWVDCQWGVCLELDYRPALLWIWLSLYMMWIT
jgi:hypothetical protein